MEVTIDSLGRILIPKKIRERLGLEPNAKLDLTVEEGTLHLHPKEGKLALIKTKSGALVITGLPPITEDLVRRTYEDQVLRVSGRHEK